MKTRIQIQSIPEAEPITEAVVFIRSLLTGITLSNVTSDTDGFATYQQDGHIEPYYLYMSGLPGGDKFWRSDEMMTSGPTSPWDWPVSLRPLGNGVVAGYEGELAVSVSGTNVSIRDGAAIVLGHPFVQYTDGGVMPVTRPVSGTRTDRIVVRLYPPDSAYPGKCDLGMVTGLDTIGTSPDLTQSESTYYEIPLARVAVPAAGALTVIDERQILQPGRHEPVTDEVVISGPIITDEAGGEALSGLSITLDLPDEGTYDITTSLSAIQGPVAGSTSWVNIETFGPQFLHGLNVSNPGQVAVDSTGRILVTDTDQDRLVIINSSGEFVSSIKGLSNITGVCVDPSDNIYVAYAGFTRSYTSGLVQRWSITNGGTLQLTNLATDGTTLFGTYSSVFGHRVHRYLCSTGAAAAIPYFGSTPNPGSGNGEFNTPWGITYYLNQLLVVDQGNNRVQVFNTTGTYQSQFSTSASGCRGIAIDSTAKAWICRTPGNFISQYDVSGNILQSIAQESPSGIDITTGDVLYVSNATGNTIAKWDEVTAGAGYGELAIDTDLDLGTYVGPGNREAPIKVYKTSTAAGGIGVDSTIRAFGKATSGDATFSSLVLTAEARLRR